jgi:phosphate transport system substrate-binding protein
MFRSRLLTPILLAGTLLATASCGDDKNKPTDTLGSGTIDISVDETYRPVIEEQLKVFDSSFPNAHIRAAYKPESECFQDLMAGKVRLILATRTPMPAEKQAYAERKIVTHAVPLARDGVAVVVSREATDSVFVLPQLVGILTGQYREKRTVVFDNAGSSTVRFITDSLLKGGKLGPNVFAAKSADSVIAYVAKNPDAIGFVGLPYVMDGTDDFRTDVRIAAVKNDSTNEFLKPYQAYVALRTYPLTRTLFFVSKETYPGLGTGFANFLSRERGQLLFQHAGLFPLQLNVVIRDANINPASPY